MGSSILTPLIAHPLFWILLCAGWVTRELGHAAIVSFIVLWVVGMLVLPRLLVSGAGLFPAYVAILDIALVLLVFKSDVRLR